jgi:signal transduction histidine kinase
MDNNSALLTKSASVFDARSAPAELARAAGDGMLQTERERHQAFVATLVHEFRQPLSALVTAVEMARAIPGSSASAHAMDIIARQSLRLTRVVDVLLDAAKWAQGKMSLRRQVIDVRELIGDAAQDAAPAIAARQLALRVVSASEPVLVDGDPDRLRQVLSNLVDNAIKYTGAGGRITMSVSRVDETVILRVRDSGRGLDAQSLTHIFDLFSQVRPSEGLGLGVGLSVAREIVLLHGGAVVARSAGLDQGCEFIVTLPLPADSAR